MFGNSSWCGVVLEGRVLWLVLVVRAVYYGSLDLNNQPLKTKTDCSGIFDVGICEWIVRKILSVHKYFWLAMFIFWGAFFFQLGMHKVLKIVNTYIHNAIGIDKRKGKRLKLHIRLSCWIFRYFLLSCMQPGNTAFSYILMSFSDAVSSHSLSRTVSCQITTKEMRNSHSQNHKLYH